MTEANASIDRRAAKAVESSRTTIMGKTAERLAPLLPDFPPYDPRDVQWIGSTIDVIVWDGLQAAESAGYPDDAEIEIVFLEVKTGKSRLDKKQRFIRKAVEAHHVKFREHRIPLGEVPTVARAVTAPSGGALTTVREISHYEDDEDEMGPDEVLDLDWDDPEAVSEESPHLQGTKLPAPIPGPDDPAWDDPEVAATYPVAEADFSDIPKD